MRIYKHKEIIFLLVLTLIFFWRPIINHHQIISFYNTDLVMLGTVFEHLFTNTIIQYGEIPLWNPNIFSGTPFVSNSLAALFYPFHYLKIIFPTSFMWSFMFMLDVFLMGTFTYLFAQKINLSKYSSVISAITYMFTGAVTVRMFPGHGALVDAILWFPLILLFYETAISDKKIMYGIYAGIAITLMFFSGHVQYVAYGLITASIYFAIRSYVEIKKNPTKKITFHLLSIYIISLIVVFSLIPIQLLPSLEFSQYVDRSGGVSFDSATTFSITPQWLLTLINPEFFGSPLNNTYWHYGNMWELCMYVGILPLILVFIAIFFCKNNIYKNIFLLLSVFSILFALGRHTPVFGLFYTYVPGIDLFRVPARMLFVFSFSIAILSGIGMDFLIKNHSIYIPKITKYLKPVLLISIILTILSYIVKPYILSFGYYLVEKNYLLHPRLYMFPLSYWHDFAPIIFETIMKGTITFILILLTITIVFYWKSKNKITLNTFKILIILILILDLFSFGMPYVVTSTKEQAYGVPEYVDIFTSDPTIFRVYDSNVLFQQKLVPLGIEVIQGEDANYLQVYQDFLFLSENKPLSEQEWAIWFTLPEIENLNALKLLNTKYILTNATLNMPELKLLYQENNTKVYEITDTLPRAFIIRNATIISNKSTIVSTLQSSNFNIREKIILEENPGVPLYNSGQFEEATITYYSPNKIIICTNSSSPGFLVLSQTWYPGWKVYDNGIKAPLYKTDYALKSTYITEGPHQVTFEFNPDSYRTGKFISAISLIIWILLGTFNYLFKEKER